MPAQHRLERRAELLGTRLRQRVDAIRDAVAAPGQRPPFYDALSRSQALDWWSKNRHTDLGRQVLGGWTPDQIAGLDSALAGHLEQVALTPSLSGNPPAVA